ncbi:MAG: hypothetical protein ACOYOV_10830 [Bacteroidales bacterium]
MAGANSSIQITDLDFNTIKNNFKNYLRSQDTFKDYNFEGSGMSVLLDVLSYNTQYNAYYLNMVANEMFLDSAVQRSSVISQAKLLNYTAKSAIAPTAEVSVVFNNVTDGSLTLPAGSSFLSSAIDSVNYNFVNSDSYTVNAVNNTVTFPNVKIKQGVIGSYSFSVDLTTNPSQTFEIPNETIDLTTLKVSVQNSTSDTSYEIYNRNTNYLTLSSDSKVYFIQESLKNTYEIYFGDGVLGKKLVDGNIVNITYLSTEGLSGAGANSFVLMDTISGYAATSVNSILQASQGGDKESIDSIKFQAPKAYAAQGRAVSKNDYITAIQQNLLGYSFDAVNVWGGEENNPPVYGQVFISLKPAGTYSLTTTQKQRIISEVIKPISVLTVTPIIVDPDYTYIKLTVNVVYDTTKTTQTAAQIEAGVKSAIQNFGTTTLNTFNSTFNSYNLLNTIQSYNNSIITSEYKLQLQKKFLPNLINPTTYNLNFNTPLQANKYNSGTSSAPSMQFRDLENLSNIVDGILIEEVPTSTNSVESISIINPGFGYTSTPTVTIQGDGTGATAHAMLSGVGAITKIIVDNGGNGYTAARVTITSAAGDSTGQLAAAVPNLSGRSGTLRSYYNNYNQVKTIFNSNVGSIDYQEGSIILKAFNPYNVNSGLGILSLTVTPTSSIISSSYNKIITIDPYDPDAIVVNVIAKNS